METDYPNLGVLQPKNLSSPTNRIFGSFSPMREIDSAAFGARLKELREEKGLSQGALGELCGYSDSNIGWFESGKAKRPQGAAYRLASPLQTTPEWLLWKQGPRQIGPKFLPAPVFVEKYQALASEEKALMSEAIEKIERSRGRKRHVK